MLSSRWALTNGVEDLQLRVYAPRLLLLRDLVGEAEDVESLSAIHAQHLAPNSEGSAVRLI